MNNSSKYCDIVYEFKGIWDIPSKCGLKIYSNNNESLIIATELYEENPGTSVTDWSTQLATEICLKNNFDPFKNQFVVHTPEIETKLTFNRETFYLVKLDWNGKIFENPEWKQITKEEIETTIKKINTQLNNR